MSKKYGKSTRGREEEEANYYAICLLMPREYVKKEFVKLEQSGKYIDQIDYIKEMSKIFKVSQFLMYDRLKQLELLDKTSAPT